MFRKVWELFLKYKEMVLYLVFGGLTTLVNIVTYALFAYVFNMGTVASTALAWIVSVIFAYITNKIFVFKLEKEVAWCSLELDPECGSSARAMMTLSVYLP